jgi:hypothetical protein
LDKQIYSQEIIDRVENCLCALDIVISRRYIARELYGKKRRRSRDELYAPVIHKVPEFLKNNDFQRWASEFNKQNDVWLTSLNNLRGEFLATFTTAKANYENDFYKRQFRFSANSLIQIDLKGFASEIVSILLDEPWKVSNSISVVDSLGKLNLQSHIKTLIDKTIPKTILPDDSEHRDFIHALGLRALRYTTFSDYSYLLEVIQSRNDHGWVYQDLERLQASETLLYLINKGHIDVVDVGDVEVEARDNAHIRKNLILLDYHRTQQMSFSDRDDWMIASILQLRDISHVLEEREPNELFEYYRDKESDEIYMLESHYDS